MLDLASTVVSVADRAPASAGAAGAASAGQHGQGQGQGLFARAQASLSKDATQTPALRAALDTVECALLAMQPWKERVEGARGMGEDDVGEEEEGREALSKGTALRFGAGHVWA